MKELHFIFYETTNLINGKIYLGVHGPTDINSFDGYIGNGIYITQPHTYSNPTRAFQFAVKKYGPKNFRRKTLAIFPNSKEGEQKAYKLEEMIVNAEFILRKDVYNVKIGGSGGASYYVKVYQFNLNGKLEKEWANIVECGRHYNVSDTAIRNKIIYKKSIGDHYFSFNNSINISEYTVTEIGRKIYKYLENGKFVNCYDSISECSKKESISRDNIIKICNLGTLKNGYHYSFKLNENYVPPKPINSSIIYIYKDTGEYVDKVIGLKGLKGYFHTNKVASIKTAVIFNRLYKNFQFSLEYKEKLPEYKNSKAVIKVAQYDMEGKLIKIWDTQKSVCDVYGSGVRKVMKGQQKHCHNFIFKAIE